MLGHIAKPRDAGGFEADARVEAAGDGAVDDRLLLLFEELDQPLLRADQPGGRRAVRVEKAHDKLLLRIGGNTIRGMPKTLRKTRCRVAPGARGADAQRLSLSCKEP